MPPRREPGLVAWIARASAIGLAVTAAVFCPIVVAGVAFAMVAVVFPFALRQSRQQQQRQATARAGESICRFARSFARRSVDPWILRAIYEELQHTWAFPIRAGDHFERDLWFDVEDVELLAVDVAARARRSLPPVANDAIETVRDLVLFLERQPRLATPA